jgi:hypothetical protein
MMRLRHVLVALAVLGLILNIPVASLAQDSSIVPDQTQAQQPSRQAPPQLVGGVGTVVGVDQPENCLKVRSGPGSSYDVIGCVLLGTELNLTGIWTSNDWVQLTGDGWVYGPQISTDLRPPQETLSQSSTYAYEYYPVEDYGSLDWDYLPDYGYATYWSGGVPIIVYNSGVWWRHHPWWWWSQRHAGDPNRNWMWNRATGINRNLIANRSNLNRAFNRSNLNRALRESNLNRALNQANLNRTLNQATRNRTLNEANLNNRTLNQANLNRALNRSNLSRAVNQANLNRTLNQPNIDRNLNQFNNTLNRSNLNRTFNQPNLSRTLNRPNINRNLNQFNNTLNRSNLNRTFNQSNLNRTFGANQSNVLRSQSNWNRNFANNQLNLNRNLLRTQPNLNRSFAPTNRSNISNFNVNRSLNRANTARSFSSTSPNLRSFAQRSPSSAGINIKSSPQVRIGGNQAGGTIRHR